MQAVYQTIGFREVVKEGEDAVGAVVTIGGGRVICQTVWQGDQEEEDEALRWHPGLLWEGTGGGGGRGKDISGRPTGIAGVEGSSPSEVGQRGSKPFLCRWERFHNRYWSFNYT